MKPLAQIASMLAVIALIAMLSMHALAALFLGSWDQDGLGSLGFWSVVKDVLIARWWVYLILISILIAATTYLEREKK